MRFLIDNALSPAVASSSTRIGHDAVHVRELGMHTASDEEILDRARTEDRAVVSPLPVQLATFAVVCGPVFWSVAV